MAELCRRFTSVARGVPRSMSARVCNQNKWGYHTPKKSNAQFITVIEKNMMELLTKVVCQRNNSSVDDARAKNLLLVLKGIFLLHEGPFRDHPDQ